MSSANRTTTKEGPSLKSAMKRSGKEKRSICFADDGEINSYCEGPDLELLASNRRDIWYQYEELKNIKRKAMHVSKEAQRYGLGSLLTNTYGKNCADTQEALNTWARNGNSRRGLERWINDEYAAKRSDIRKRTIHSVIRAQAKMREANIHDPDYTMKVLSRLSEAFSIDSKQFARGMGMADEQGKEHVAENTNVPEKEHKKPPLVRQTSPTSVMGVNFNAPPKYPVRGLGLARSSAQHNDMRHYL